jgi:biotin carboxylase
MEAAARLGGGFIASHLVPLSTGIDLVAATIRVAFGESPDLAQKWPGRAAAIRFLSASPGRVARIDGLDTLRDLEGLEEAEVYVLPGETIGELVDASGRPGHVMCSAPDADQAIALAEAAQRHICIHTDRAPSA